MNRRIQFIAGMMMIISFTCSAQNIYVDLSNNTGIEDGTEQHPFNTINEGINAASAGDTVFIRPGTYTPYDSWSGNDHTLLLKAGVKLIGENRDNTIVNGIVVDQEVSNLSISLENLTFDMFSFARASHAGPFPDQNIIRNCKTTVINLPFGSGIPLNDTTPGPNYGFLIENNDLGSEGSIEFKQGAGVSHLSVIGNTCGYIQIKSGAGYTYLIDNNDVQFAIFDKSGANTTTISNNRIINGTIDDKSGGNQFGVEDEIIENNTISASENSPAFLDEDYKAGIRASSRSVTIRNNTITCTGNVSGIRVSTGAPMHILNNTITLDEVQQPYPEPYDGTIGIMNYSGWGYVTGNKLFGGNMGYFSKAGTVLFANNEIRKSYTGFYSKGAEEVHHNLISECKGDGMILDGLKGPLYANKIKDNSGSGIRVTRVPIDLGGGGNQCQGINEITGNGNYDLYIETSDSQHPLISARYNVWDHLDTLEIMQYDIYDGNDSAGLVKVDFTPVGTQGTTDPGLNTGILLFPNPCMGMMKVMGLGTYSENVRIELLDSFGRLHASRTEKPEKGMVEFDVSSLSSGIYYCRIIRSNIIISVKIIKE
jgi:hypothetical protein